MNRKYGLYICELNTTNEKEPIIPRKVTEGNSINDNSITNIGNSIRENKINEYPLKII